MELLLAAKAPVDQANKNGRTSLLLASMNGHSAPVQLLLADKANVYQADKHGRTSLIRASMNGHNGLVETLLAAKAPVDHTDKYGNTSLSHIYPGMGGNREVRDLLESWSQLTPLMRAVVTQSPQEMKALLHEGADPTCTVQLLSGTQTAHSLAMSDPPRTWFSTTCSDTVELISSQT